jgi:polysaccharide biosynthesis/export protein
MKTNICSFRTGAAVTLTATVLAFAFTGCETTPNKDAAAAKAGMAAPHSETIVLREGDVLKITFPGSANLDAVQPIRRDGKLNLPLVGEVDAAGLTPDELQKKLVQLYSTQISSKEIIVQVQSSSFPVYVTGSVIKPGKVMSDHPITALEAVMEAGGPNYDTANLKSVHIDRNENGVMQHFTVNLKAVLVGNDHSSFYLKPGDIVYVPEKISF